MASITIAGGGIGGLCAALCLHEAGHDVHVYESVRSPVELGVGINVLPHSVRVLDELGLLESMDAIGVRTGELRFVSRDGIEIWSEPRGVDAGNPWPQFSVHRGAFHMMLWHAAQDRLGPDRLHTGMRLARFEHHDDDSSAVVAHFTERGDDPTSDRPVMVESDVLVGADGIHSVVRQQLYPGQGHPHPSGLVLWRGAIRMPAFLDGRTMFMAGDDGQKAVVYPISDPDDDGIALVNWVAERPVDVDMSQVSWNKEVDVDSIADHFTDWDFGWIDIGSMIRSTDVAYEFPMVDRHPVERWSFGRVTMLGDAAHPMRPNGSNGSSQAILDGEALTTALGTHGDDVVAALAAYESERLDPTARLTLANRQAGPERVMQWVAERCDGACRDNADGRHACVPESDLEREANAYKELAGFDLATLQSLAS